MTETYEHEHIPKNQPYQRGDITTYPGSGSVYSDEATVTIKECAQRISCLSESAVRRIVRLARAVKMPVTKGKRGELQFCLGHVQRYLDCYGYGRYYPAKSSPGGYKGPTVWF